MNQTRYTMRFVKQPFIIGTCLKIVFAIYFFPTGVSLRNGISHFRQIQATVTIAFRSIIQFRCFATTGPHLSIRIEVKKNSGTQTFSQHTQILT